MSVYGFDLDGTLDHPAIAQLANDLFDAGHQVWVITGGLADSGEWTMESRVLKLQALGVKYTGIMRCLDPDLEQIGRLKGKACNRLGVSLYLDDMLEYLRAMDPVSEVQRLLVLKSWRA